MKPKWSIFYKHDFSSLLPLTLKIWRHSMIDLRSISEVPLFSVQAVLFGLDSLLFDLLVFVVWGRLLEGLISELFSSEISASRKEPWSVLTIVLAWRAWIWSVGSSIEISGDVPRTSSIYEVAGIISPSSSWMRNGVWMHDSSHVSVIRSWTSSDFMSLRILIKIRVECLLHWSSSIMIVGVIVVVIEDWMTSVIRVVAPLIRERSPRIISGLFAFLTCFGSLRLFLFAVVKSLNWI